ncbi:TetR/AcrR family transcriptional regulator [Actinotalea ferrariae]|uniref:TetR/AcrR family transcriptional regulator n=1 Tax=Actinotalea ferrariae TaxID=1386098 RepID=UPI001C8B7910|nr:TetR/AcrR family transcriptional regulator [Actinotalea ferrariae]MBX9247064.1 TetR/AcrR family transcriptional regulator [Actinotalea ferrariae]
MPRPRTHDDALRARLLEVTSEALSTGGPATVTVRDVARRAGTSASAVYALFGSRDALLDAVTDEAFRRFAEHLARVPRTDDAGGDLLALGLAYRASALDDPHFYRVMFDRSPGVVVGAGPTAGASRADLAAADQPAVERPTFLVLRDAVARVLADRPGHRWTAEEAALGLWGHVHGLVSLELAGLLPGSDGEHARRYAALLAAAGTALLGSGDRGAGTGPRGPRVPG